MFKKITITTTILIISFILLTPVDSLAQRGGRGTRGGTDFMMGGPGGYPSATAFDANSYRNSKLLTYLVDANNLRVDPNKLSAETLQAVLMQIGQAGMGGRNTTNIIDANSLNRLYASQGNTRNNRDIFGMPEITDPNDPDPLINVSLNQVDLSSVIRMLIQWTGKAVVPSPDAQNLQMTIYSPSRMKKSEAINLIYSVMRQYGFVAETQGNIIYINPVALVQRNNEIPLLGPEEPLDAIANKDDIVRKIFKIKNYSPSAMGQMIIPFLDSYGYVTAEESTGTLMISDNVKTLMRIQLIIQQFDVDLAQTVTETLIVQHRDPEEMATLLESIMSSSSITSTGMLGGFNMGMMSGMPTTTARTTTTQPRATATSAAANRNTRGADPRGGDPRGRAAQPNTRNSTMGAMSMFGTAQANAMTVGNSKPAPVFIPDKDSKIIICRATSDDMVTVKYWLAKLDTKATVVWNPEQLASLEKNTIVEKFYYLQYNSPSQIAQIIEPLLTDSGYLSAEENTGTLMVIDTAGTLLQLEGIIKQFDVPQADVASQQIFEVKNQDPRELVNLINLILSGDMNINTTSGTAGRTSTTGGYGTNRTSTNRNTRTGTTAGRTTGMGMGGR